MAEGATKDLAVRVIKTLRDAGHEALLAGGCVRDMLLGIRPNDYDVATSATPRQVKRLFRRVVMVGAKFGVAMVIFNRRRVEVTTFRSDISYSDGRRPDGVKFVSAREDALRRDFTINGMFFDPIAGKVVDYVGGRGDLEAGIVRAIGKPRQRFSEDHLRMLRAVRFSARFGFRLHEATAGAIRASAGRIAEISGERIREELEKMFANPSADRAVRQMRRLGLLAAVLPELFLDEARWARAIRRVEAVAERRDVLLTLGALTVDLPASNLKTVARRWGASNAMRDSLIWMAEHIHDWSEMPGASPAELKRRLAHKDYARLERLWHVEEITETGADRCFRALRKRIRRIRPDQIAPAPFVTGQDLKRIGAEEGPLLGRIISAVYEAQLNQKVTDRRSALRLARELLGKSRN